MSRFSGVYPILYAFYDKNGKLDDGLMRLQVEKCIAAGAHGITVLGLVTEVHRLDVNERRHLGRNRGRAAVDGGVLAVTIGEQSIHGQIEFATMAKANGASWLILQPPSVKGLAEAEYIRFLGCIADALDCRWRSRTIPSTWMFACRVQSCWSSIASTEYHDAQG